MKNSIEINCDLGEGEKNEALLLPFISSCSIACGGHYGTKETIKKSVDEALNKNVRIGAHPSYPDKINFGRKPMEIEKNILVSSLEEQLENFLEVIHQKDILIDHIKPHGALYHAMFRRELFCDLLLSIMEKLHINCPIIIMPGSCFETKEISIMKEAFLDRRYDKTNKLLPRSEPDSMIYEPIASFEQWQEMNKLDKFDSYCIHGDNPKALEILEYIREHEEV